ncbi:MAG TPA: adenylate/guanylate cyclase domain-containing protein [Actinomycetota bacterium]|nr:adenylate/guanylate cyclase domain-containing protein [Actinomycetota bacterium]
MTDLPTGTVTFLFTDIEGSTGLLQVLGDRYPAVLDTHAELIRRAVAEGGGVEVSTHGDAFFVVFRSPAGAVRAAIAAQRALAAHDWPAGSPVRVRMGVHTGEGVLGGDDYAGLDVHRAARIADAAHGGQVLLSDATRGLVQHTLPAGASLRDLGEHRLRGLEDPERLHQLVGDGLAADFPPPRTLDARPNNLPLQLTSFVGREEEIVEVERLLGQTRLLTLTGPGGSGKTRLALQAAGDLLTRFRDGAWFVDLSPVTDPALVPAAVANALGVPEDPGRPILDGVKEHLRHRELLGVADNFEQVAEAAAVLEELLTAAPRLRALVTSRVVLSLRGEQEYPVPALGGAEAVRLFAERAVAASPRFALTDENAPVVADICARLDGLPLAIELAATRTKVLTPDEILSRLERRLSLLTSGARSLPERQRTLRAAIAWSYDLLDPDERRLFARLSVFSGGWTFESAEAVCAPGELGLDALDGLTSLVDKSLIRRSEPPGRPSRFSMLETIREFGLEQLEAGGDLELVQRRHAEHFLGLATEAEPHLVADDQGVWLDRCQEEHANIRAALRWAIDRGEADAAQAAAGALWRFWQQRGHLAEGRRWLAEALAMPSGQAATAARAKALTGAGGIAWWSDQAAAHSFYDEALAIERELGDPARMAEALYNEAFAVAATHDLDGAARLLDESLALFRQVGDEHGVVRVLGMLVVPDAAAGAWDRVVAGMEEVVAIWRRLGDRLSLAFGLIWLAFALGRAGRRDDARATALEALALFREADNATGIALAFLDLAFLLTWEGRHTDALRMAGVAERTREEAGGGPTPGFGGMLEGDPAAEARAHLTEDAARRAFEQGLAMTVGEAAALAGGDRVA